MLKLSDVPARALARDSSSRRDEVIAAHAINDARSPMARTNPASRSFSVVCIVVGSRQRNTLPDFGSPAPLHFSRRCVKNPSHWLVLVVVLVLVLDFRRVFEEENEEDGA